MTLRVSFQERGAHVHCRVFAGKTASTTLAQVGVLIFGLEDWPEMLAQLGTIADMRVDWLTPCRHATWANGRCLDCGRTVAEADADLHGTVKADEARRDG